MIFPDGPDAVRIRRAAAGVSLAAIALVAGLAWTVTQAASRPEAAVSPTSGLEETIQVTATRLPEDILDVPATVTVIPGDELEARGVRDLAGALALVGGVSVAPGGDGGPASSVPELMGLREFDAFLLVVDGVPWGGAFNPALATLDLTDVERVEVLRGSAPVLYGATSFVGVIHVIHRSPGATPRDARAGGGSYDSFGAGITTTLPGSTAFRHSLSAGYDQRGFPDDRTGFDRLHALWSGAADLGGGHLRLWVDLTRLQQDPASPHPRQGAELSSLVPVDANHNPSDAKLDDDRYHVAAGYDRAAGAGTWSTTFAVTHAARDAVRGFLREDFDVPPAVPNADGFRQELSEDDLYIDTHWSWRRGPELSVVTGIDVLAGKGKVESENFEYHVGLDGSDAPSSGSAAIDERPEFEDERAFDGAYARTLWSPAPCWRIDTGLRLNVTREKQEGEVEEQGTDVRVEDSRSDTRLSGSAGASFRVWSDDSASVWLYGRYTDAFKPAAVDFGPEAEGEILEPETARTYEAGVRGSCVSGGLSWNVNAYRMDFDNLVIAQSVMGLPSLANAGKQRFKGVEAEGRWRVREGLTLSGSFAAHSAKFRDYVADFDGTPTQLAGNRLEMSPDRLASLGLMWSPQRGPTAWAAYNHVGERYLNKRNTAIADPYAVVSLGAGWRFRGFDVRVDLDNLTDARDSVSESELGDAQYYRLPARSVRAALLWHL